MTDRALARAQRQHREAVLAVDDLGAAYYAVQIERFKLRAVRAGYEAEIIKAYEEAIPITEIARRAHVSRTVIYKILHRCGAMEELQSNTHKEDEDVAS